MRELEDGEVLLSDAEEVLRRQVHPAMADENGIMKGAFMDDDDWMSTAREAVPAAEAYRRWTVDEGYPSIGTYGVRVGDAGSLGMPCVDDASHLGKVDHASVVSEDLGSGAKRRAGRVLRDAAVTRGALFSPL